MHGQTDSARQTGSGGSSKGTAGKVRSSSNKARQRKRVEAEVRARHINESDVAKLQMQLLPLGSGSGAKGDALMDAARQLLRSVDYEAVVEERALEGLCGYPLCSKAAVGEANGKVWKLDFEKHRALRTADLASYCSDACHRESDTFSLRLQPEPSYIRPASAIAASRSAVAEAKQAMTTAEPQPNAAAPASDGIAARAAVTNQGSPYPDSDGCAGSGVPVAASAEVAIAGANAAINATGPSLPKPRKKATVRFSRECGTYSVRYDQYDGGGDLPEIASAEDTRQMPSEGSPPAAVGAGSGDPSTARGQRALVASGRVQLGALLAAPVVERETLAAVAHSSANSARIEEARRDFSKPQKPGIDDESDMALEELDAALTALAEGDDGNGDNLEVDAVAALNNAHEASLGGFVRTWGVLSSWYKASACGAVLHRGAALERVGAENADHAARRALLGHLLQARVNPEATFLAPRFQQVLDALWVHQTLPSVADLQLYDLLAAVLLRAVYRADQARGACHASAEVEVVLEREARATAKAYGVSDIELELLDEVLSKQ